MWYALISIKMREGGATKPTTGRVFGWFCMPEQIYKIFPNLFTYAELTLDNKGCFNILKQPFPLNLKPLKKTNRLFSNLKRYILITCLIFIIYIQRQTASFIPKLIRILEALFFSDSISLFAVRLPFILKKAIFLINSLA